MYQETKGQLSAEAEQTSPGDNGGKMTASGPTPDEKAKRKAADDTVSPPSEAISKRPRRSDHARGVHMDSIATIGSPNDTKETKKTDSDEIISQYAPLPPLPKGSAPLQPLTNAERKELERYLDLSKEEKPMDDWLGALALADKEITNPDGKSRERTKKSLLHYAEKGKVSRKLLTNLFRCVYNLDSTPKAAKEILATMQPESPENMDNILRRAVYDPKVLRADGWTTKKAEEPVGASGGPFRIGEKIFWEGNEGVVIAYVHDNDLGDLWKGMWLEFHDTFDLEVEELEDAKRRFERKMKQKERQMERQKGAKDPASTGRASASNERRSVRNASSDFHVPGIEHGIVLAVSYGRGARPGVFWPARVVHFSEMQKYGSQKRASNKQKIDVVFLAPYWNAPAVSGSSRRLESYADSLQRLGSGIFSAGPLFELETIDASPESVQQYPYGADRGLDLDELAASFRFAGLPKAAFKRFVDSHRLALGLKTYSQHVLQSTAATDIEKTTAGLFEAHPLAGQTASIPDAVLHLPFSFILSQLPPAEKKNGNDSLSDARTEPALQLGVILDTMKPPTCWGREDSAKMRLHPSSPERTVQRKVLGSPPLSLDFNTHNGESLSVERFLAGLSSLATVLSNKEESMSTLLTQNLSQLLSKIPVDSNAIDGLAPDERKDRLKSLVKLWIVVKTHGEELISSYASKDSASCLLDWRRACERIYKHVSISFSSQGAGNGISWVVSDSICNLHVTSTECFERRVRLPAAMRVAKQVAKQEEGRLKIMNGVKAKYLTMTENEVLRRVHQKSYLLRMKQKCTSVEREGEVVALTEDSEGNGGEDTMGTRGSWKAAVAAAAASVQAVDMIMNGECVNAFCLTRPPGHHAGRQLHAMKAVSNGFCLLNNAACAALYATSPVSEGGPGLRRVCVIDIDVHHGNGTQDILCSTYDPRFLYVSIHAGGPDVNGVDQSSADPEEFSHHLARNPKKGIFPGRCGDTSPHEGVLNIPLGARVTSHSLGAALVTKVTPAVEKFSPELIIISAGFDAHKNDPLGLGGLSAEDFGTLTEVICKLAHRSCSGRVLSVLEGGYGVPCCRMPNNLFDPDAALAANSDQPKMATSTETVEKVEVPPDTVQDSISSTKAPDAPLTSQPKGEVETPVSVANGGTEGASIVANGVPQASNPAPVPPLQQAKVESIPKPLAILDLGDDLPEDMNDNMPYSLMKRLDKCHAEGFMDCVREHITTLAKSNMRI